VESVDTYLDLFNQSYGDFNEARTVELQFMIITYPAEFGLGTADTKSTYIDLATVLPIPTL
jgi:hypothetical protein